MDDATLARVLARNPNINVPRPRYRRPDFTQPFQWTKPSAHVPQQATAFRRGIPYTLKRKWLRDDQLKTPWYELHPELRASPDKSPPPPPTVTTAVSPGGSKTATAGEEKKAEGHEQGQQTRSPKRQKIEPKTPKGKGKGQGIPPPIKPRVPVPGAPPTLVPSILPISPQAVLAPRVRNAETRKMSETWAGPGTYEYKWKDDPNVDENRSVRDGIPANWKELPQVREMPVRKKDDNWAKNNFQYMGDQKFYSMTIPASGDCFFGAISMALYGTTQYWHFVKYCHLWFFRYVLLHPAHPRYEFYWHLNAVAGANNKNMWHQPSIPHAWQSSELFNVTADIYNLFIILYEQLPMPTDPTKSTKQQDDQTIGLFGQYNATHVFFHLINRNHYQTLVPSHNHEAQFPFPDGMTIVPRPGRTKQRPPGGRGRSILPPPIAQPIIPEPNDLDITRVLGINTQDGALDLDLIKKWIEEEWSEAARKNDQTSVKWWVRKEKEREKGKENEKETETEKGKDDKNKAGSSKVAAMSTSGKPTNQQLASKLGNILS
ncbi:hypothetical protein SBOR_1657 [Sclerotinia borealis F-4128]|uniref:OTU domain-containing protein n=1 Tax=Sclerotinia borealis (strain F-4128) TaxID=1432307 RepID=W9CQ72_SCLBF|nr:hypothetical protein SBOR_1657 [Sclerotinia borealis F-4128]